MREVHKVTQKFIPLEKQSKRKQQAYHEARRKSWGGLNPVTKRPPNPKAYSRKKSGQSKDGCPDFAFKFRKCWLLPRDYPLLPFGIGIIQRDFSNDLVDIIPIMEYTVYDKG